MEKIHDNRENKNNYMIFDEQPLFYLNGEQIDLLDPFKVSAQIGNRLWDLLDVINKYNDTNALFFNNKIFSDDNKEINEYWFNIFKIQHAIFIDLVLENRL